MSGLSRNDVQNILERYFLRNDQSEDIVTRSEPEYEVNLNIVDHMLGLPKERLHDQDYVAFKHYNDGSAAHLQTIAVPWRPWLALLRTTAFGPSATLAT